MSNPVDCPNCSETIDAVEVICVTGRCPECDTPLTPHHYRGGEAASDAETLFEIAADEREHTDHYAYDA
jgi:predicted amidophosphoribosyltransferase